jgi:hypothetical protein
MGRYITASGDYSTAMGHETTASGWGSTAMGVSTTASEWASTAMGYDTTASGTGSVALGYNVQALGDATVVLGRNMICSDANMVCVNDLNVAGAFYPRRLNQSAQPAPASKELLVWRDTDDGKVYLVYSDPDSGALKVELT